MINSNRYDAVIISPHPDDAVLSMSGTIKNMLQQNKHCLVLNVFVGRPNMVTTLSEIAIKYIKEDLEKIIISVSDACILHEIRQQEDQKALNFLGVYSLNLKYLDAIYRGDPAYYPTEDLLFDNIHTKEKCLIDELGDIIINAVESAITYYFPLGVGNHVDHQIVFETGLRLHEKGYNVRFYEEYPYCIKEDVVEKRIQKTNRTFKNYLLDITPFIDIKTQIIKCYGSQIAGLFQTEENLVLLLETYHRKISNLSSSYYERVWLIS